MTEPTITLVDAPDRIEDPEFPGVFPRERQRILDIAENSPDGWPAWERV